VNPREAKRRDWRGKHRPWSKRPPAAKVTRSPILPDPGTTVDDGRYFHDVGLASRIRVHREMRDAGATSCPYCTEEITG
jgi:hypothetical protein